MKKSELRKVLEQDLELFIRFVSPETVLGQCHRNVIDWWQKPGSSSHQLLLYPRDHGKSRLLAFRVAQALAKDPTLRILYVSATTKLAEKQLHFIKQILSSKQFMSMWPEHIVPDEGKRAKWTQTEIMLDHPDRDKEKIRDASVATAGLTTTLTGLHADIIALDDIVVHENAYMEEGREKVRMQYSYLSSIATTDSKFWMVGTRYHPSDLYSDLIKKTIPVIEGDKVAGHRPLFDVMQEPVEDVGDGSGVFLWPRQRRKDGKWFGFDRQILEIKKASYSDRSKFRAQYYNDPSDPENNPIKREMFFYFDKDKVSFKNNTWYYLSNPLKVHCGLDLAYSLSKTADYTAIVVIGIDQSNRIFVLDMDRFRSEKLSETYKKLRSLHEKWGFTKVASEANGAQKGILSSIREDYILADGLTMSFVEPPNLRNGTKRERIIGTLLPKYSADLVIHPRHPMTQVLEEELLVNNPSHDDVSDALAMAVETAPRHPRVTRKMVNKPAIRYHGRFGGRL